MKNMFKKAKAVLLLVAASLVALVAGTAPAMADVPDFSTALVTGITGASPQVVAIVEAIGTVIILLVIWAFCRSALGAKK
jgi:hypothetical protein